MMREAVAHVLGSSCYRERAAALAAQLVGVEGADTAADEIELLLSDQLRKASYLDIAARSDRTTEGCYGISSVSRGSFSTR